MTVLRKGKTLESCHFDGDDLETTIHFGLYLNQELVGVVSRSRKIILFFSENQSQIRGMAVLESQKKKDFGKKLILYCEEKCKNSNTDLIWFNARIEATPFYENGIFKIGKPFEIPDVGEHIMMLKKIRNE